MENGINHLNVELTKRCNLKCSYCFNDSGMPMKYELSLNEWNDILNVSKNYGAKSILITGGEFMMRNDSIEILNFALDKGFKTSILSNGYKVNNLENSILNKLQKAQISVDSYNKFVHDARRGEGSWEVAISAINYLRKNNVPIEISATISNIQELEGLAKLAMDKNSKLLVRPLQALGRSKEQYNPQGIKDKHGDIIVEDFERYVPIEAEHDKKNLEKGIITILPDGNLRGINSKFYEFFNKKVA